MQDRPTARELLATVAGFLRDELLPALDGPLRYRTLVAANLLGILEREEAHGVPSLLRERELLCDLLALSPEDLLPGALPEQVADLNQQLAAEIDGGAFDARQRPLWAALEEVTRAKLAICRPGYDAYDPALERP